MLDIVWAVVKFLMAVFVVCAIVYGVFVMIRGETPAELNKDVDLIKDIFK